MRRVIKVHVLRISICDCRVTCDVVPSVFRVMSMLDRFRKGAQKAGLQATAFVQASSTKVASGSRDFVHGFSLPGEAEKAANILDSFLGAFPADGRGILPLTLHHISRS